MNPTRLHLAWCFVLSLLLIAPGSGAAQRLNVILILADDLGAHDLGCTGSRLFQTPNIDALAAQGMRFTQAYAACTVCSPSRAAVMTGRYPARLHLTDWIHGHDYPHAKLRPPDWTQALPLEERTLAEDLKERGYTTIHIGKWHLGGEGHTPEAQGFDRNLGGDERGQPPSYFVPYHLPRLPDGPSGEYLTDREGEEAARYIADHRGQAFFLNYWPYAVHTPLQAPADRIAFYRDRAAKIGGPQTNATYAAMVNRLDAAVGRILEALTTYQLADHTLVVFGSDNGGLAVGKDPPTSNAPLRAGKGSPYEGGHRVPLIVRWPGVTPAGSTCSEPVIHMDLRPTILEAVGAPLVSPAVLDGVSLVPLLRDPSASLGRDALFWHYPHYHPGGATPYAAVRSGDWKFIQFYENGLNELFNLASDPGEQRDLASSEPDRAMQLARLLFAWQGKVAAQWPMPNPQWQTVPLASAGDGSIHLHASDAFVHGAVLRYEPQPFKNTLGWWTRPEDWVEWTFDVATPGPYRLEFLHGCGTGSGGSEVRFSIGDAARTTTIQETGGFQNFTNTILGEWELTAGLHALKVVPVRKPALAVMDLREVVLRPVTPHR